MSIEAHSGDNFATFQREESNEKIYFKDRPLHHTNTEQENPELNPANQSSQNLFNETTPEFGFDKSKSFNSVNNGYRPAAAYNPQYINYGVETNPHYHENLSLKQEV